MSAGRALARWGVVAWYVSALYLAIPYVPRWWNATQALTGVSFDLLALLPLAAIGGLVVAAATWRSGADLLTLLALTALGGIYYYLSTRVFVSPIENLHLIEYGLLSWILWWAWRPAGTSLARPIAGVWLLNAAVGATDEMIQHYTPGRFGEFRDVVINWQSAALGLAVLLVLMAPWKGTARALPGAGG